jgi:Ca2+/H+ antiporter
MPDQVKKMVNDYFAEILICFTVREFTIAWQNLEKRIATGCTTCPILFVMGMSLVTTAIQRKTRRFNMSSGMYQPPIKGFMDDLMVTTMTHIQTKRVVTSLEDMVLWV